MEKLSDMRVFVRVMERRSFTAAGKELRLSTPTVSKHIARLEEALSLRLLLRSTHHITPTEAGSVYYDHCVRILAALQEAQADAAGVNDEIKSILLDAHEYQEWLCLSADAIRYRVTARVIREAGASGVQYDLVDADTAGMQRRVDRLSNPKLTYAENPPSFTRRFITIFRHRKAVRPSPWRQRT